MAISETKWFPNSTFLGFPNSIEIHLFFQLFYFQFNFKFKFKFNTFFVTDILTENGKLESQLTNV